MDIKKIYNRLTGIDISEQLRIWDERGKGYYGEFLVFSLLYQQIPGVCKILMNLEIPVENGKTTEVDLLMIHETGIYVFEIKHYKGVIYGKDTDIKWTQFFRTEDNQYFDNPILQNEYHIKAIKKLFPNVAIKSIIVFTNDECDVRVDNNNEEVDLCNLKNMYQSLRYRFSLEKKVYTIEEIDSIFKELTKYSKMQEKVLYNGRESSFISWLEPTILMFEEKKKELEIEKNNLLNKTKKLEITKKVIILALIVGAIIWVVLTSFVIGNIKEDYDFKLNESKHNFDTELSLFKQNFIHVDEIGNPYVDALNDYVTVSNVSLVEISNDCVSFTARLSMSNDIYGVALSKSAKYIVMTNYGRVYEYDVFGTHLHYNRYSNMIGKGIRSYGDLKSAQFFGVNKEEISYIKITNIELFKLDINKTTVKNNLELELYRR